MNKKGNFVVRSTYLLVAFLFIIMAFAFIPAFIEILDDARGASSTLNCPGTPDHNPTAYADQTSVQKQVRRPVCFITGLYMVIAIFAVIIASIMFAYKKWTGQS